ncbi:MAG: 30S ribosomal protein S6 [FCB group bacterium]|nr:30S ribosomal protein S6 [FCB group bacterium]
MRRYETTCIIDGALETEKIEEISKRTSEIITNAGGNIIEEKHWGKRRLAYEIKKRQYGYYIILTFEAEGNIVEEIERFFRLNQYVLRYLSILLTDKDLRNIKSDLEKKKREEEKALELSQAMNKSED